RRERTWCNKQRHVPDILTSTCCEYQVQHHYKKDTLLNLFFVKSDFSISVFKGNRCPDVWMRIGCNCYYKSTEEKDWHDSRDFCKDEGSDLVVVNSKEEQVGVPGSLRVLHSILAVPSTAFSGLTCLRFFHHLL
uniref:C-type lectin domain-containing protein n=1 Tax=Oryzias latipes TaxID=8090 RepID=A0A3P9M8L7_ORYLA